ncbi:MULTISPECIES: glycosyltransferase family 4 protein [Rhizobium]|uniref:glycosyltransferase family 4 protein n=1 Tax=Rhizobium TaxID=379 RepID=UPI0014859783|nr:MULTISPECIES: glycosyltransferase family 4 protein [Rhizobium]WET74348.1 glycosyltransferase family 4 protein [Rhizobium croatiense]
MKLLFCIKSVTTLGGGAERVFVEVANGLHRRGHDVSVLTLDGSLASSFYALSPEIRRQTLKIRGLMPLPLIGLRRRIHELAPDVVVAFMPSSYTPIAFALMGSGLPIIASEHNVPARYSGTPLHWALLKLSARFVKRFTAVSSQMKQLYPPTIRAKMDVLPNPTGWSAGRQADVIGPEAGRTLLAVGRLHPQKDHITLVQAFALLASDFPEWTLKIVGDGDERTTIEAEVKRLNLSDRVRLPGSTPDISSVYSAAQLYVISSAYESYGLATVEALAHGLPAIGFSDCAGTNELIKSGENGLLVDSGPTKAIALAAGLRQLMQDSELRLRLSKPANAAHAGATLEEVLDKWEAISLRSSPVLSAKVPGKAGGAHV